MAPEPGRCHEKWEGGKEKVIHLPVLLQDFLCAASPGCWELGREPGSTWSREIKPAQKLGRAQPCSRLSPHPEGSAASFECSAPTASRPLYCIPAPLLPACRTGSHLLPCSKGETDGAKLVLVHPECTSIPLCDSEGEDVPTPPRSLPSAAKGDPMSLLCFIWRQNVVPHTKTPPNPISKSLHISPTSASGSSLMIPRSILQEPRAAAGWSFQQDTHHALDKPPAKSLLQNPPPCAAAASFWFVPADHQPWGVFSPPAPRSPS